MSPASLAILLTACVIVTIYTRRHALPVRRVAGVFLWRDPATVAVRGSGLGNWSRTALTRDLLSVIGLGLLACGLFADEAADTAEGTRWFSVAGRTLVCIAIAALLLANWSTESR